MVAKETFHVFRYGNMALIVAFNGDWTPEKAVQAHAAAKKAHSELPLVADASWAAPSVAMESVDRNAVFLPDWPDPTHKGRPYQPRWRHRITHTGTSHPCEDFSSYTLVDQRTKETA